MGGHGHFHLLVGRTKGLFFFFFLRKTHCSGCRHGAFVLVLFNDLFEGSVFPLIRHIVYQVSWWRADMCGDLRASRVVNSGELFELLCFVGK